MATYSCSPGSSGSTAFQGALPTYAELIDLFEEFGNDKHILCEKISSRFPSISVNRPGRVYDTISRIVAPTKQSLNGTLKLTGSPLHHYRQRIWEPRVRTGRPRDERDESYPNILSMHGFTKELLTSSLQEIEAGSVVVWGLHGKVPTIGFYRALHLYLKQNFKATKTTTGRLYCGIDSNLKQKGSRPDNIYRFVERIVSSQHHSDELMPYDTQRVKSLSIDLKKCSEQLEILTSECTGLREKCERTKSHLRCTKTALRDITNQNTVLNQRLKAAREKVSLLKFKNAALEEECTNLQVDLLSDSSDSDHLVEEHSVKNPSLQYIVGNSKKYTPEIRKLYYNLLAEQVPASKIADIIRHVLRCFNPTEDVEGLQLPQQSCAAYMRKEELKTICDAQKATALAKLSSQSKQLHLHTDGTTKNQKKLGGVVASGMALGVNELQDGSAASAIEDISKQFEKLRYVASRLGLPNPNSINWTLVVSSTSDSAATQKRINKLIEECRQSDEEKFGLATAETIDLIETFCSMHLGINLRKSFLDGLDGESDKRYHRVDILVHEVCKLVGTSGVLEYCVGVVSFPEFLEIKIESTSDLQQAYYRNCSKVRLHRQVGSRYFVSAANACKILFLRTAIIEYLKFTGKDAGNKLERDVFHKLQDKAELSHVKADSLMYYHIYGDLFMLSKSKELGLSAYSMNQHYLELQIYLSEVIKYPDVVFQRDYPVFSSETRIYGTNKQVNHRLKSLFVYDALFEDLKVDADYLQPLLVRGVTLMKEKLCAYASNQLPGGRYWNPDKEVKDVLCQLPPSNDVCESILGLNDYLTSALPNLHQMSRSNLVQVKKNKTMTWLSQIPNEKQKAVIEMAVKERHQVKQACNKEQTVRVENRKQAMVKEHVKREAMKKKMYEEKQKLSQLHLITVPQELEEEMLKIDMKNLSATKKRSLKISILKTQVQIRKKVLGQVIPITFTSNRKQRPVADIIRELSEFITENGIPSEFTPFLEQPITLVGKRIKQRFQDENDNPDIFTWYVGTVIDYRVSDKTHCIKYDGEEEVCYFDLTIDFLNGDIVLIH